MIEFHILASLFIAGLLTILLPCILPLLPIVLGVSITGRSKLRPLALIAGMLVSFVGITYLLIAVLNEFVQAADLIRISTYYILFLFGFGFLTSNKNVRLIGVVLGGFFYSRYGWIVVTVAETLGWLAMELGTRVASHIQQFGATVQQKTRENLGADNPLGAFLIGLTMGLVWVPCAGPALSFALTLVREQPGPLAMFYLFVYGFGTAIPLLLVGYGGQWAVHSTRYLSRWSGRVKQVAGVLLILTALGFQYNAFEKIQIFLTQYTPYGTFGVDLEESLFGEEESGVSSDAMGSSSLPKIVRAPEFTGLGPWHNSGPLTLKEDLKGKVVLVDFWTYSCINCIRTLPYIQGYWEKFGKGTVNDSPFVVIGVHTPEFVFEKDERNVAEAIKRFKLTYPTGQDNDFGTWKAFSNRYWPAKYLIDANGYIRYTHFGEGAYEETDDAITALLKEAGVDMEDKDDKDDNGQEKVFHGDQTPEIYMGARSWPSLGNGSMIPTDNVVTYEAPEEVQLHKYYLVGDWQLSEDERQVLRSDTGEIRMRFLGGEINLVMGIEEGMKPASVEVWVDGVKTKTFTVDFDTLYELFKGEYGEHEITLKITGKGVAGYAFTFGQ